MLMTHFTYHTSLPGNWSITNLRPSNPLRPCFTYASNSQSNTQLKYELSTKKSQPTYEEDALVLRVIEAYSIAFQNTSRNTIHSGELAVDSCTFMIDLTVCSDFILSFFLFFCFIINSSNHSLKLDFKFQLIHHSTIITSFIMRFDLGLRGMKALIMS